MLDVLRRTERTRTGCLVFLLIPQFFSRVGRYTLTCYALVLILTGPATNTLKNSEVLSESMACSQEQIKTSVHHLNDLTKKPYNSMKESIKLLIDRFKAITTRVQQMVLKLNRLVFSIVGFIQYSFSWLQAISNICNEKLGSPYDRCNALLQEGVIDCKKNPDPYIAMHCSVAYLAQLVCGAIKPFKAFCCATDFMDDAILANIRKKLKDFTAQIRALFHVEVHIHRSYSLKSNNTRSASQIAAGIVTEIRNRTGPLLTWLSWSSAKYYQHMYETRSRFDNRYITKELQELDLKRQRQGRETVLPLNRRERAKYITTTSFRLVASEKMYLTRSAVFMLITTFKLLIHIVADYSLYWVLMTIRYHGQYQSNLMPGVPHSGAHVTGSGFVARLFRSIVDTFTIPLSRPAPSLIPCLPDPYPPDFRRYTQIGVLIFLLWFFALFEPYGLRLRHLIMGQYRPERAKARATWLYNHILRTRAGFMKFARRKLHRKYKYSTESSLTFRHWLNDRIPFQCLKYLLGVGPKEPHCLLCGTTSFPNDSDTQLTRCETPNCPGVYCTNCFSDFGQLCTICLAPNDYGDLSDLSLERGSSDDDESESELDGNVNISESTRLLENENHEGLRNTQGSMNRWNFFISSQKSNTQNNIALEKLTYTENQNTFSLKNRQIAKPRLIRQKKLQNNYLKLGDGIKKYTFSLDYNNNVIIVHPKGETETVIKTKSIGTNTEKRFCLMKKINFNNIFKTITIYRKQSIKQVNKVLKPTLNDKMINVTDILNWELNDSKKTTRPILACKIITKDNIITNYDIHSKCIMKRKENYKPNIVISVWKEFKGIINIIRIFNHSNSHVNSTNGNKNENSNKDRGEHSFHDMKPVMSSTPKNNETKKNEDNKRKTKGIEKKKNSNSKKNSDGDKPKKPCKDKSKKTSRHRIAIFHAFFSNHWRTVKSNIGFITNRHVDTIIPKEKKNHKRRKKRKDADNCAKKEEKESKAKKDSKRTRNYRISAFLADHDWMKRDYKKTAKVGSDDSCRVIKAPSCRMIPPIRSKIKLVAMVHLNNRPFQWRHARHTFTECITALPGLDKNTDGTKSKSQTCLKKKTSVKALERFKRRVNATAPSPSPSLVKKMMSSMNLTRKPSINVDTSSICIKKRESFYRTFRREAMKIEDCGTLDTIDLFKNNRYSEFLIPLAFKPKLSETSTNPKIEHKLSSSSSDLEKIDLNNTKLGEKTTLMPCRFDSYKDILRKWNLIKKPRAKTPSDRIYDVTQQFKKLCTSLLGSSCNETSCEKRKQQIAEHKRVDNRQSITSKTSENQSSDLILKKSIITRTCKCEPYEDIQRKWTHINNSPQACQTGRKLSLRDRLKKLCPSLFGSGCNEKTCVTHKERERILNENRLCKKHNMKEQVKTLDPKNKVLKSREREDAKVKEIQRHIEREKQIEREIALEQKRHKEREIQIEKELDYELAKHKETQKKLMCDEDSQTLQGDNYVDNCTEPGITPNARKDGYCEPITQPSDPKVQQKTAAVGSVCECKDKKVGVKRDVTSPKPKRKSKTKKDTVTCACPEVEVSEELQVCCTPQVSACVGSCTCVCVDKNVGGSGMMPCSCATQCKSNVNKLGTEFPKSPRKNPSPCKDPSTPPPHLSPPCQQSPPGISTSYHRVRDQASAGECCGTWGNMTPGKKKKLAECECSTQYSNLDVNNRKCCEQTTSPMCVSHGLSPMCLPPTPPNHFVGQSNLAASASTQFDEAARSRRSRVQKNSGRVTGEVRTRIIHSPPCKNIIRPEGHPVRNPSVRRASRRCSPPRQPQRFSTPQPQQQRYLTSSESYLSPLLLMTSPSIESEVFAPRSGNSGKPQMPLKAPVSRKHSPPTIKIPVQISDALNLAPQIRDTPMDSTSYLLAKSVFKNKSILANFSEEVLPSISRFRDIAVQAKFEPEFIRKKAPPTQQLVPLPNAILSEDYSLLLPSNTRRISARSKHHPETIIKFSYKKNRYEADTKQQYANKSCRDASQCINERREKPKSDKAAQHKGARYTYSWKKIGKKSSATTKDNCTKRRRLSLESSLCDMGNQSNLNDLMEDSDSYLASPSRMLSDEGLKTDTTYCSMATVHFDDRQRCHHRKVKFVSNNNQATSTDRTALRDAGTLTCDWWSPLLERKEVNHLEKKKGYNNIENIRRGIIDLRRRKPKINTGDGRFVKFETGTQVIPPWRFDFSNLNIMTPSRYLLESQKYYNELFAYAANAPKTELQHYQYQMRRVHDREKVRSPIGSRRAYQRKTKRLDECYSPRKSLYSPRRRYTDSARTSDSPRMRPSIYRKSVKRYYAKLNATRQPYY